MNTRLNLVIAAGFILLVTGGFMETQDIEFGNFITGFGAGVLAAGAFQFIYMFIQNERPGKPLNHVSINFTS